MEKSQWERLRENRLKEIERRKQEHAENVALLVSALDEICVCDYQYDRPFEYPRLKALMGTTTYESAIGFERTISLGQRTLSPGIIQELKVELFNVAGDGGKIVYNTPKFILITRLSPELYGDHRGFANAGPNVSSAAVEFFDNDMAESFDIPTALDNEVARINEQNRSQVAFNKSEDW